MATISSILPLCFCLLFFCHVSVAQFGFGQAGSQFQSSRGFRGERECRFDRLDAFEPTQRVQFEAGVTEFFNVENKAQFRCAGLSVRRRIVEPRGLVMPAYANAPSLVYIVQGRGLLGMALPGCPETFQSVRSQYEQQMAEGESQSYQKLRDEHQQVHRFREGDIIAVSAGVTHWCYNDGDSPVVAITVFDTSNTANQLDPRRREFFLAGNPQRGQQQYELEEPVANNIFSGFDQELLAEALGVSREVARRLQRQSDKRGEIIRVEHGLQTLKPFVQGGRLQEEEEEEEVEEEAGREPSWRRQSNGLEETVCTWKVRKNINYPQNADIYNPRGGRISRANSQNLPILNVVQMSATRIVLHSNALLTPHWTVNAHTLMYVTAGRGRVQVVDNRGKTVFDGELRQGQLLLVPQNFAVLMKARRDGLAWVSFKTNHNSIVNQIAGKASTLRALPVDVLANSFRLSREEARGLKFGRGEEMAVFTPRPELGSAEYGRRREDLIKLPSEQ